jgi:hypothetical protein
MFYYDAFGVVQFKVTWSLLSSTFLWIKIFLRSVNFYLSSCNG